MKEVLGGILMAVGILIAGASGLCSLMVLFGGGAGSDFSMFPLVALFGGPPLAVGVGLIFGGRALIRNARREKMDPSDIADTFR